MTESCFKKTLTYERIMFYKDIELRQNHVLWTWPSPLTLWAPSVMKS